MGIQILFIHPGNHKKTYQDLASSFSAIDTPYWEPLLAGYLRNQGFDVAIYDVNVQGWNAVTGAELLSQYQPELVVFMVFGHHPSASTQTMPAARYLAADVKAANPDIPIAMGGTHPAAIWQRTLQEEPIDFVIKGEGAYGIRDLTLYLQDKKNQRQVRDVYWKSGDALALMGVQSDQIKNMDNVYPEYAWDLLPSLDHYRAHNWHCFQNFSDSKMANFADVRMPYASIYTAFGCPYSCEFCCINAVFGKPGIRYWSLTSVINWIDQLVNIHGVKNIRIADELFILAPKRIERFCDLLIERNYDLNLWAYGTVDTTNTHLLKKLRNAGLRWVCLGIEAGNTAVLENVNKKIKNNIFDVVARIQDHGIHIIGNYMFGLPEDNLTTMRQTLDLAKTLNCEFVNFNAAMPYPGSKLYDKAQNLGFPIHNWNQFSQYSYDCLPLPTKYITSAEVLRFRDQAFTEYFSNPKYQQTIEEKFGHRVVTHINDMLTIKIKRKILENCAAGQSVDEKTKPTY